MALGLAVATASAGAQEHVAEAGGDAAELEQLLQILAEETEVATRTRMNGDFVPGIVSVLTGEEMEALGFETVWEALSLVPGIQVARDILGTPTRVMGGLQFPFNSGNVKILLDGMPLSREDAGVNGIVLDTPVALVERIEVIRGPGSVV
jgi:iron complex outermembrane receptor protein